MILYPAIDLMDGKCVRLAQGRFDDVTQYDDDPVSTARAFAEEGAAWIHVVDLDGARAGAVRQVELLGRIAKAVGATQIQAGGGVRSESALAALFAAGVTRVVVGSVAVSDPETVRGWLREFGSERLTLAFDVGLDTDGLPRVATHGWQKASGVALADALAPFLGVGLKHILCTDVGRDGMLTGPNVALYSGLKAVYPQLEVQASGGIASLSDLTELRRAGIPGAILGKALYERRFRLAEALRC